MMFPQVNGRNTPSEIVFLYHLRNENKVVRMLEWFENHYGFHIIMQYVENSMDLKAFLSSLEGNKMPEVDAVCVFKQVITISRCSVCDTSS